MSEDTKITDQNSAQNQNMVNAAETEPKPCKIGSRYKQRKQSDGMNQSILGESQNNPNNQLQGENVEPIKQSSNNAISQEKTSEAKVDEQVSHVEEDKKSHNNDEKLTVNDLETEKQKAVADQQNLDQSASYKIGLRYKQKKKQEQSQLEQSQQKNSTEVQIQKTNTEYQREIDEMKRNWTLYQHPVANGFAPEQQNFINQTDERHQSEVRSLSEQIKLLEQNLETKNAMLNLFQQQQDQTEKLHKLQQQQLQNQLDTQKNDDIRSFHDQKVKFEHYIVILDEVVRTLRSDNEKLQQQMQRQKLQGIVCPLCDEPFSTPQLFCCHVRSHDE